MQAARVQCASDSAPTWLVGVLVFCLAGANGYRFWWSSIPLGMALLAVLFIYRSSEGASRWLVERPQSGVMYAFAVLAVAGVSSWLATAPDGGSTAMLVGAYLTPLLMFLGLHGLTAAPSIARTALRSLFAGAGLVLAHGLVRFYLEFGIPTGLDLFFARAQQGRIDTYMQATYGNVGSTSSFMSLVLPPAIAVALSNQMSRGTRALAGATILLAALNFAIIQSRTLLVVLIVSIAAVSVVLRVRIAAVAAVGTAILGILLIPLLAALDDVIEYVLSPVQGSATDASAGERTEAMIAGWKTMIENVMHGVGPGRTIDVNPYTSAHQFWVQQGSELGVPGLLAALFLTYVTFDVVARASVHARRSRDVLPFALALGPGAYMLFAVLANAPLAQGSVNAWSALFAVFLTLASGYAANPGATVAATHAPEPTATR